MWLMAARSGHRVETERQSMGNKSGKDRSFDEGPATRPSKKTMKRTKKGREEAAVQADRDWPQRYENRHRVKRQTDVALRGSFWLAEDVMDGSNQVEIEVIWSDHASFAATKQLSESEQRHPNVQQLLRFHEMESGLVFVVREAVNDSGDLFDHLAAEPQGLRLEEVRLFMVQILATARFLHSQGLVHRNIKPESFFFSAPGHLKLIDFGLMERLKRGAHADWNCEGFCGTPEYVAPEVLQKSPYGPQCDVWSAGVVLYTMLVGFPPFHNADFAGLMRQIAAADFNFRHSNWSEIPAEAKDLVGLMLTLNPEERASPDHCLEHPFLREAHERWVQEHEGAVGVQLLPPKAAR